MTQMGWHMSRGSLAIAVASQILPGGEGWYDGKFEEMHTNDSTWLHFPSADGASVVNSETLPKISLPEPHVSSQMVLR